MANTPTTQTTGEVDLRTIQKPTKKQRKFIEAWLIPSSETFGNAYESARSVGYSESASRTITGNARGLQWIQDAKQLYASLEPEHIYLAMQKEALNAKASRDRLSALTMMAKIKGMFIERSQSQVNVTFNNNVPRPIINVEPSTDSTPNTTPAAHA